MGFRKSPDKLIQFIAERPGFDKVYTPPQPASKYIPEWYKKMHTNLPPFRLNEEGNPGRTVKACMPVFDVMTAGYIISLPSDVLFFEENNGVTTQWPSDDFPLISMHGRVQYETLSIPSEFHDQAFKFNNPWIVKTPPGYSSLFMQPSFHDDLPFQIFPGIVDTDRHPVAVNFPFLLKRSFSGILPMDTPIVQVIPFRRDSWNSEVLGFDPANDETWKSAKRKIMNRYKTFFRQPKVWR